MRIESLAVALSCFAVQTVAAQVITDRGTFQTTLEGWANATMADCTDRSVAGCPVRDGRVDAALRALLQTRRPDGPDFGLRIVLESSPEDSLALTESSVLLFGNAGRFEFGERQGLPDVLTGYAPNSFTFTSAEFGPASGPSLDPGGGLPASFLPVQIADVVHELGGLGYAASLYDDRATKALYVAPKMRGWLFGVSYAEDAEDPRYAGLLQTGLVHEAYWRQNVLRVGGTWTHAAGSTGFGELHSVNLGATLIVDDALAFGFSVTGNGSSGIERAAADRAAAGGWVASVNYNSGPWTLGAYYQRARAEGNVSMPGDDRLDAIEFGLSWRASTRMRIYGAWYRAATEDEGSRLPTQNLILVGIRVTL